MSARLPAWIPAPARDVDQIVLLVLDGLGWVQLQERAALAPSLSQMAGAAITSVAPTTTATALTSIATGTPPAVHGVVGYRLHAGGGEVMNILRWRTGSGDARSSFPPASFQPLRAFGGRRVPVVTRAGFGGSGFTDAHLSGTDLVGWELASSIKVEVGRLLREGVRLVYAYYDGIDLMAHLKGFGEHYDAELAAADRIVGDLLADLPARCALLVTADHGQVEVRGDPVVLDERIGARLTLMSGEGRFRWLHVRPGETHQVAELAKELYGDQAWVRTREEIVGQGWFGGQLEPHVAARLGDVALVARRAISFHDPADAPGVRLICRHGSLTPAEMLVPLLAWAP
jgi:predicted AlkP superfamily pyrophosphatase or phosphodiesterase